MIQNSPELALQSAAKCDRERMERCASPYLPNFRHPVEPQHTIIARVAPALCQILRRFQLYSEPDR